MGRKRANHATPALRAWLKLQQLDPQYCCDEKMAFGVMHDGSKAAFAASTEREKAELVITVVFLCEKCQAERPIPFNWPQAARRSDHVPTRR